MFFSAITRSASITEVEGETETAALPFLAKIADTVFIHGEFVIEIYENYCYHAKLSGFLFNYFSGHKRASHHQYDGNCKQSSAVI